MTVSSNDAKSADNAKGSTSPLPMPAQMTPFQRALMVLVAVMGVMLLAGFIALVGRLAYIASQPSKPASTPNTAQPVTPPPAASADLNLPAGADIKAMSLEGNRLAVHYTAPGMPGAIAVIDLSTGRIETQLQLTPTVPSKQ